MSTAIGNGFGGRAMLRFLATALGLAVGVGSVSAGELRAGAAAVNITPPLGIGMAGYYHARGAQGTHDDLFAKAIVLEHEGRRAALVVLDLIATTRPMVEAARQEIEKTAKVPGDHVMLSATHAHTGPVLAGRGQREAAQGGGADIALRYSAELPGKIAQCVQLAASRLEPVRMFAGTGHEDRLSYNRRFHMKDGTVGWNPGKRNPNIVRPAGPIDPEVGVLLIEAADAKPPVRAVATYVNFAMHPDTVGGQLFSADYPGVLARRLAEYKGPDMVTLFANGTCGNLNHLDVAWADPQKGPHEAARIGTVLAAAVLQTYKQVKPVKTGSLRAASQIVKLPLAKVTPEELDNARAAIARLGKKENVPFLEQVQAYKALEVAAREGKPLEVEVQVIALGDDVAWVGLPGEVFVELGLAIKKASPFRHTMIAELANNSMGYVPNRSAYAEGNYEVISARCAEGSGELLVETAVRLLKALQGPVGQ
ncbi:MAG: hypothetical protein NUV77_05435 [Thermoguttaceae bacterium]|jgi:hypothetical protein|nr:hypothetical protein [Thermoguttaceae bacterium]